MLLWLILLFMIFAVFDLLPLTVCINCSFLYLGLYYISNVLLNKEFTTETSVYTATFLSILRPKTAA